MAQLGQNIFQAGTGPIPVGMELSAQPVPPRTRAEVDAWLQGLDPQVRATIGDSNLRRMFGDPGPAPMPSLAPPPASPAPPATALPDIEGGLATAPGAPGTEGEFPSIPGLRLPRELPRELPNGVDLYGSENSLFPLMGEGLGLLLGEAAGRDTSGDFSGLGAWWDQATEAARTAGERLAGIESPPAIESPIADIQGGGYEGTLLRSAVGAIQRGEEVNPAVMDMLEQQGYTVEDLQVLATGAPSEIPGEGPARETSGLDIASLLSGGGGGAGGGGAVLPPRPSVEAGTVPEAPDFSAYLAAVERARPKEPEEETLENMELMGTLAGLAQGLDGTNEYTPLGTLLMRAGSGALQGLGAGMQRAQQEQRRYEELLMEHERLGAEAEFAVAQGDYQHAANVAQIMRAYESDIANLQTRANLSARGGGMDRLKLALALQGADGGTPSVAGAAITGLLDPELTRLLIPELEQIITEEVLSSGAISKELLGTDAGEAMIYSLADQVLAERYPDQYRQWLQQLQRRGVLDALAGEL